MKVKKKKLAAKRKRTKNEDAAQRKKYARGGRIEAYTFGEALGSKR